ncbi:hypothetical protein S40288_11623 [Stachybotrys chartarum IBT 40288]|nr:hypothetical protein S40288_11623 [Stachybotrys chartarum IBT 40288]
MTGSSTLSAREASALLSDAVVAAAEITETVRRGGLTEESNEGSAAPGQRSEGWGVGHVQQAAQERLVAFVLGRGVFVVVAEYDGGEEARLDVDVGGFLAVAPRDLYLGAEQIVERIRSQVRGGREEHEAHGVRVSVVGDALGDSCLWEWTWCSKKLDRSFCQRGMPFPKATASMRRTRAAMSLPPPGGST